MSTRPSDFEQVHVVVMGVSGTGKTTVATVLADDLGATFAEGDDFHPRSNVDKMSASIPLTDKDRWPWLRDIAAWASERSGRGVSTVVTCSALRRAYRDLLRAQTADTFFVHLDAREDVLLERMRHRSHYMPASLLRSQLDTLEPLDADEAGITVSTEQPKEYALAEALTAVRALTTRT